jgi:hypothetical protein
MSASKDPAQKRGKMASPRVTIVVPVFNGANYMRAAIDSALAQDYSNLEVLVVNDGSCDGDATDALARSYGDRIHYINKPNGGVASALNAGIAAMTGEIFCWLSHDDIHLPDKTSRQVAFWEELGRPPAVLIGDYRLIDAAGAPLADFRFDHALLEAKPIYALLRGSIHGCTVLLPRILFDEFGLFDEGLPTTQDYDLWHRMIFRVPFLHMPEILIESRWHDEQGSKRPGHREEARQLWRRMTHSVPVEEQVRLEGSSSRFLSATSRFLNQCGLTEVAADLATDAEAALDATLISIILSVGKRLERTVGAIGAVAAQRHPSSELILVAPKPDAELNAVISEFYPEARLLLDDGPDAGWRMAKGCYIVFVGTDDLILPEKLELQLRAMDDANVVISCTAQWLYSGLPADPCLRPARHEDFRAETVMVRRGALERDAAENSSECRLEARLRRIADAQGLLILEEGLTVSLAGFDL